MTMAPILNLSPLFDWISPATLPGWLARMTLLATLGCAFLIFAHRARPAVRHAVAVGSLLAVALLPMARFLLPDVSLPVLPAASVKLPDAPPVNWYTANAAHPVRTQRAAVLPASVRIAPVAAQRTATPATRSSLLAAVDWRSGLLLIWLNVAVALLVRAALASFAARRLVSSSVVTDDENILRECRRASHVLGITRPVDVRMSREATIPLVVGALRARVILPAAASAWSRERLSAVLLHEFAHVRRRDNLWVLAANIVTALFWFHPLVWMLSGQVRREAERACDDVVLAHGVRGSDYATHLVAIARTATMRGAVTGAALTFATRSSLEKRVVSILSTRTPRAAMSRRSLALLVCVSLVLLGAIATVRPTSAQPEKQSSKDKEKAHAVSDDDRESGRDYYSDAAASYDRGRYSHAAMAFSKAAEAGYRRPTALYNAGCSYALANETDDAIESLRAAFEAGFDRPDLYASDDDLNSLRGDKRFQQLLDDVMKSDAAQVNRRDANREFDRLAKSGDVDEDEWNSVGIDLMRSGDYDRAADAFDREYKASGDEDALYNKACARALAGNKADALKLLEQAITTGSVDAGHMEEDPDLFALHSEKRFDELLTMAQDLTLSPSRNWTQMWSWSSRHEEKRWRKSLTHFEEMTEKYPQIGRAWFNLGFAQLQAEEAEKGTASFQRALELGYQKPTTMYNLACCAAQTGNTDAAFDWLEKADAAGFESWSHAHGDDDLDPIRSDPRFKKYEKHRKGDMSYHYKFRYDHDRAHDQDEDAKTDTDGK